MDTVHSRSLLLLRRFTSPSARLFGVLFALTAFFLLEGAPTHADQSRDEPLPARPVAIEVDMQERAHYRLAIPSVIGGEGASTVTDVLRNDMKLGGEVLLVAPADFPDSDLRSLQIKRGLWTDRGIQGVIKGELKGSGNQLTLELRFYEVGKKESESLKEVYRGPASGLRDFAHRFSNEVLRVITGTPGAFDTELLFARRLGPGRKDVMRMDYDGARLRRVSPNHGISLLPAWGARGIWFSRLTDFAMFITNSAEEGRAVLESEGLNMGAVECNGRLYFTSTRDGNSEIYSSSLRGDNIQRLTHHPAIDVSPTCGPHGEIAFVSSRHGSPQIFLMNGDGSNQRRITYRGSHNQTPAFCPDPAQSLIAFTGRDGGLDIFTLDLKTKVYTRLTQGQGANKDPTFSPDCRMIAFHSSRGGGGIYVTNQDGLNQHRVLSGHAETLRWSPRR